MNEYDNDPGGPLTAPLDSKRKQYKVREIIKYCKEHNIHPQDLSEEELEQFVIKEGND